MLGYCSAQGPVACQDGFALDPMVYGPADINMTCATSSDAGVSKASVDADAAGDTAAADGASLADARSGCPGNADAWGVR